MFDKPVIDVFDLFKRTSITGEVLPFEHFPQLSLDCLALRRQCVNQQTLPAQGSPSIKIIGICPQKHVVLFNFCMRINTHCAKRCVAKMENKAIQRQPYFHL
ncbi:hypothetical protein CWS02_13760 [Enterobacter sp. EA-1]|nr:hypothetical protein CWS02_13760 [Enterobacter sp. EA-1]